MTYVSSEPPKRTLPPAFSRPKIEISAAGREWLWVLPEHLKEHDIIADFGLVQQDPTFDPDSPGNVVIHGPQGAKYFRDDRTIWAFTRPPT